MQTYTFKVYSISGSVARCDFLADGITVQIEAETISKASDSIRQYLSKEFLKCDRIVLEKIEISK